MSLIMMIALFPVLNGEFSVNVNFNVRHTERKRSAVPIDQALEKAYNKVTKEGQGVIGFTKQKEAVAKWSLV